MSLLEIVAPYVAKCKITMSAYYCKMALSSFDPKKIRTLTLPILSDVLGLEEMGYPDEVMIEFKQVKLRKIDPEIYYFFYMFDSVDSVDFRKYMYLLGLDVKSSYNLIEAGGHQMTLITTSDELHCVSLFENIF